MSPFSGNRSGFSVQFLTQHSFRFLEDEILFSGEEINCPCSIVVEISAHHSLLGHGRVLKPSHSSSESIQNGN